MVVSSQRPRDKMPSALFGDAHVLLANVISEAVFVASARDGERTECAQIVFLRAIRVGSRDVVCVSPFLFFFSKKISRDAKTNCVILLFNSLLKKHLYFFDFSSKK